MTGPAPTAHATTRAGQAPARAPVAARLAAAALVVGSAGNLGQAVLLQLVGGRPKSVEDRMTLAADHGTTYAIACLLGLVAVPLMAIGFWSAARLLAQRLRKTGIVAGVMLVAGMWGFQCIQVVESVQLAAMLDGSAQGREAALWLDGVFDHWLPMVFGVPFLLMTPPGMMVLTIAALITAAFPRWIAAAWLVFIVVDFAVGPVGPVDPHWLYFGGAVGLAAHMLQGGGRAWRGTQWSDEGAARALP